MLRSELSSVRRRHAVTSVGRAPTSPGTCWRRLVSATRHINCELALTSAIAFTLITFVVTAPSIKTAAETETAGQSSTFGRVNYWQSNGSRLARKLLQLEAGDLSLRGENDLIDQLLMMADRDDANTSANNLHNRDDVTMDPVAFSRSSNDNSLIRRLLPRPVMTSLTTRTAVDENRSYRDSTSAEVNGVHQRLPNAIIIGVKKSGTRALLEFLRSHPDVRAPGPEIHFFDKHYDKGLDWYRSRMPNVTAGQLTIEKTPSYFITRSAPSRVHNMSAAVRLIVVVRDPVTRAVSDYTQAITKRPDIGPFERRAFVDRPPSGRLVDTSWGVIKIGLYCRHLERWLRYFPLEQIHFVHGERLISNPAGELARVQDFLGLRRVITGEHFYFNTTKGFPCLRKISADEHSPHCLGKTKGRTHPAVDEQALRRLRQFYRPFNAKFYEMTGIDFGWS